MNQRDNANRNKHFFSACDGHSDPVVHTLNIQSPKDGQPEPQYHRIPKLKQKNLNKNVKSMQIDNSIENQYYISS